jgi:hypothetical protein
MIILIIIGAGLYIFFKPHRNVQRTDAFAQLKVSDIINEFNQNSSKANAKYLSSDGNSRVLIIEGRVSNISENLAHEKVVVLKEPGAKVGVSCTFNLQTSDHVKDIKVRELIKVKGAITAGNSYDDALELYNDAILVQCDIIK